MNNRNNILLRQNNSLPILKYDLRFYLIIVYNERRKKTK